MRTKLTLGMQHRVEFGSIQDAIMANLLILWDGTGFFGTKFFKLARLEGVKFEWWHKFKDPMDLLQNMIIFMTILFIIIHEVEMIGSTKA